MSNRFDGSHTQRSQLWAARAINGTDDDAEREFQRAVSQVVAETASEE